ncbi:MAG: DUF2277 family protein [Ilumatobacter sp.]|nr:DUF2277 family protein [bacterium]NKB40253.1 DUF2277 family protein [Ilumatobacter sp.]
MNTLHGLKLEATVEEIETSTRLYVHEVTGGQKSSAATKSAVKHAGPLHHPKNCRIARSGFRSRTGWHRWCDQ